MLKIFLAILLTLGILWSFYSLFIIADDGSIRSYRDYGKLVTLAKIYWWIIILVILFMFSYGIVNKIMV